MEKISELVRKYFSLLRRENKAEQFKKRHIRSLGITGASCAASVIMSLVKLAIGIYSASFFVCANAFYTLGIAAAKLCAVFAVVKSESPSEEYVYYKRSGKILILASAAYVVYSVRLFIYPTVTSYTMITALTIATVTFAELVLNIRGVIIERNFHSVSVHAIKMINLASTFISLVLTQSAILSFTNENIDFQPHANGFFGIIMGAAAMSVGVIMTVRIRRRG